jgi:clavulanate-9-aldehyde reducatase
MEQQLQNKVVIVTGASSGIGEETARQLAGAGASVVLVARRKEKLILIADDINANGGRALPISANVTSPEACQKIVATTIEAFGQVDLLVNNAGLMLLGNVLGTDTAEWAAMVQLNMLSLFYMCQAVLPHMSERTSGHIINVSSTAARFMASGSAVYNATKAGVNAFTESLRLEMVQTKTGIRTTVVEPGVTSTELLGHNKPEVLSGLGLEGVKIPTLEPEDIARTVVFVASQPENVDIAEVMVRPNPLGVMDV